MASAVPRKLVEKIASLPPEGIAHVEAFVDAMRFDAEDRAIKQDFLRANLPVLAAIWDNPDDAAYDEL